MELMIKGIPVVLYEKTVIERDEFDHPIYKEHQEVVGNVLVAPASTTEILDTLNLTGKKQYIILQFQKETGIHGKIAGWISLDRHGR